MMLYFRLTVVALCGAVLLSVTACSDPASVGADIAPTDSLSDGDPQTVDIVASSSGSVTTPPATGLVGRGRSWRFLTGTVTDELAGTIETDGYIDFLGTEPRPDTIASAPVDSLQATLQFDRAYRHGDTTTALQVELYDLTEQVDMARAPADTSFPAEASPVATYSVDPTDASVSLSLPPSWIAEHQSALQSNAPFEDNGFYGLKLSAASGAAVVGFDHGTASLQLSTSADTVAFTIEQSFTHIERTAPPSVTLPDDRARLVDGVGTTQAFNWNDNARLDSLIDQNTPLNGAEITVPVDTAFRAPPANFVRPAPSGFRLLAGRRSDGPACFELGLLSLTSAEETCVLPSSPGWVPGAARAASGAAFSVFDRWLRDGRRPIGDLRVELAARSSATPSQQETTQRGLPSTIPAVVYLPGAAPQPALDIRPRATLFVTPL